MESVDGLTAPPSFVQSGCNQTTNLLESTDGLMYPTHGLMETSERCESESSSPLVVTELDAVDEHLSSDSNVSEATIPVAPAMHAMAPAGICPNFSPGDPFIIIEESEENSGEKYPVTSSTVAGEPVCWERSAQDATVTTSAADSEQKFRIGHWDDSHENSSLCVETSVVRPLVVRFQRTAGCCHWDQQSWRMWSVVRTSAKFSVGCPNP